MAAEATGEMTTEDMMAELVPPAAREEARAIANICRILMMRAPEEVKGHVLDVYTDVAAIACSTRVCDARHFALARRVVDEAHLSDQHKMWMEAFMVLNPATYQFREKLALIPPEPRQWSIMARDN